MRITFHLLLLISAIGFLSFPASAASSKNSAYDRVVAGGTIRCGYGISPPLLVKDPNTGALSGLNYELWQEIGKELGLKIEWAEEAGWGNFIEGLRTGRYDAFCSLLWPDPARARHLSLAGPVVFSLLNTYVRADDHRFDGDLEKLNAADVTLPAIDGDVSVAMAQNRFPFAKILSLPQMATVSDMFMAVTSGKADALFLDQAMFATLEGGNKGALRKLENVLPSFVYGSYFGVLAEEIQLRDMIQLALRGMINDGRLEVMAHRYDPTMVIPRKDF